MSLPPPEDWPRIQWTGSEGKRTFLQEPLQHLISVIAIASLATSDDITISLTSLDNYEEGFLLRGTIVLDEHRWPSIQPARPGLFDGIFARVFFLAHDDKGQEYHASSLGFSNVRQWPFEERFDNPLNPMAAILTLTVTVLEWLAVDLAEKTLQPFKRDAVEWSYVIDLRQHVATVGQR